MSGFSRSFKPWENHFTEGLYLAGVEAADEVAPPAGWVKWTIPGYEYLYVKCTEQDIFVKKIGDGELDDPMRGQIPCSPLTFW